MPEDSPFDNLRDHLESMFQFENNDLDVGIYKVLRLKQKEVEAFLKNDLEQIVRGELSKAAQGVADAEHQKLATYIREETGPKYHALVVSPETVEEYQEKLRELVSGANNESELVQAIERASGVDVDLEDRVYNHLLAFFGRYYRNGDFGYNDRSLATYKVDYPPAEADYSGDDVLLHWKHKDSYYIKTANGFPTVRFEVNNRTIEYRLETGGEADEQARTRNSNKDDGRKHYVLDRVEEVEADDDSVWHVVFRLAERSTPKDEVYSAIMAKAFGVIEGLDKYLYRPGKNGVPGKSAFYDLEGDYDKVENGAIKGQGQLRLALSTYLNNIYHLDRHKNLGSNKEERQAKLAEDETVQRLIALDRHLNRFYVGIDADYFVHKDLGGFLGREAERYVKDVVLSGVEGLLSENRDETAFVVARAFYRVTTRITEFLAVMEDFQKNLFLLKKKVIRTDWLISVGKLTEWIKDKGERSNLLAEVHGNESQRTDWKETFGVEIADPNQLLLAYPTLPIDTRYMGTDLKLTLLAYCPDLEEETIGTLICSENLQAVRLLADKYRGKIDCIYIDPPYNTKYSEILYKNDFKHSSWLSMMNDRVSEAAPLLKKNGVHIVAIDENEQERLGLMLRQVFPDRDHTCVTIVHNPSGQQGDNFSYSHDFAYFSYPRGGSYIGSEIRDENVDVRNLRDVTGESAKREAAKNCFYPILVEDGSIVGFGDVCPDDFHPKGPNTYQPSGIIQVYPIDPQGQEMKWRLARQSVEKYLDELDAVYIKNRGVWDIRRTKNKFNYKTVWQDPKYSSNNHGSQV